MTGDSQEIEDRLAALDESMADVPRRLDDVTSRLRAERGRHIDIVDPREEARRLLDEKYPRVRGVKGGEALPGRMSEDQLREWVELAITAATPATEAEKQAAQQESEAQFESMVSAMYEARAQHAAENPYGVNIRCPICGIHWDADGLRQHLFGEGDPEEVANVAQSVCRRDVWGHAHHPDTWEVQVLRDDVPLEPIDVPAPLVARVDELRAVLLDMAEVLHKTGSFVGKVNDQVCELGAEDDVLFARYNESSGVGQLVSMVGEMSRHFDIQSTGAADDEWLDEFQARYGGEVVVTP